MFDKSSFSPINVPNRAEEYLCYLDQHHILEANLHNAHCLWKLQYAVTLENKVVSI